MLGLSVISLYLQTSITVLFQIKAITGLAHWKYNTILLDLFIDKQHESCDVKLSKLSLCQFHYSTGSKPLLNPGYKIQYQLNIHTFSKAHSSMIVQIKTFPQSCIAFLNSSKSI